MGKKGRTPASEGSETADAPDPRRTSARRVSRNNHAQSAPAAASDEDRQHRIALAAYYRAERRGFTPGQEIEDWLAAEAETEQTERRVDPEK